MSEQSDDKHRYRHPTETESLDQVNKLKNQCNKFLALSGYKENENWSLEPSDYVLHEIYLRLNKRAQYYLYFHDMSISERKQAGLFAYWILRFYPIKVTINTIKVSQTQKKWLHTVNERFAAHVLYAAVYDEYGKQSGNAALTKSEELKDSYYKALLYSLRFRHISMDAMLLLAETMTLESFARTLDKK